MNNLEPIRIPIPTVDLSAANEALAKMTEELRGLKMYNEAQIRAIKAAAWDEGFTACAQEHMRQREDSTHPITRENPHNA